MLYFIFCLKMEWNLNLMEENFAPTAYRLSPVSFYAIILLYAWQTVKLLMEEFTSSLISTATVKCLILYVMHFGILFKNETEFRSIRRKSLYLKNWLQQPLGSLLWAFAIWSCYLGDRLLIHSLTNIYLLQCRLQL